ncbi:MAG: tetratricopeptide repeat protein [Candidatus Eremiobacteraeota bacterium]|nr:tetratricopeptide repeat protein [Candidatus Eremiobacteraeota bacterium]
MRPGTAVALALTLISLCGTAAAHAQTMPGYGVTPAPRSTDPATMRNAALFREIRERFGRGNAALDRADYPAAIAEFEAVLKRNLVEPQNSTAHYNLALALSGSGNLERAASELRIAIEHDPGFLAAYANLIAIELRRGDVAAAREAADKFVKLAPDSARALYSRGLVALQADDLATARADFSRLIAKNAAYAPAHYDLALVELRGGRFESAERELNAALAVAPNYPRARFALGVCLLREGRKDEARQAFDRVLRDAADPGLRNLAMAMRDELAPR